MPECVTQEPAAVTVSCLPLAMAPSDIQKALDNASSCSVIVSLPVSLLLDRARDRFSGMLDRMEENSKKIRACTLGWGTQGEVGVRDVTEEMKDSC